MLQQLLPWLPASLTLVLGVGTLVAVHLFLNRGEKRFGVWAQLGLLGLTLVLVVSLVATIPVEASLRAQLFSLLGVVLSAAIALSSTTFIGNAMAGLMLSTLRNFRAGDFVQVGDHVGRVSGRGLFHTELQTETSDLTTLPNLFLVTNAVTVVRAKGTLVTAEASLGYDVSRHDVEAGMLEAALAADLEAPFVQVIELGDFSVLYRVSGLLREVKSLISARSRLRAAILDSLHAANIEVVSPNFMNTRSLGSEARILPKKTVPHVVSLSAGSPESLVFDKAEVAGQVEELKDQAAANEAAADLLKEQASEAPDEPEAVRLAAEAEKVRAEGERLKAVAEEHETASAEGLTSPLADLRDQGSQLPSDSQGR